MAARNIVLQLYFWLCHTKGPNNSVDAGGQVLMSVPILPPTHQFWSQEYKVHFSESNISFGGNAKVSHREIFFTEIISIVEVFRETQNLEKSNTSIHQLCWFWMSALFTRLWKAGHRSRYMGLGPITVCETSEHNLCYIRGTFSSGWSPSPPGPCEFPIIE